MDLVNVLLLMGIVLFSTIGALIAIKRAAGKKVFNFVLLLSSFFGSIILLSAGVFDFLTEMLVEMMFTGETQMETLGNMPSVLVGFLVKLLIFVFLFWIMYGVLKLLFCILFAIFKVRKTKYFKKPTKETQTKAQKWVSGVFGGLTAWFFFMFSLLPIFAFTWLVTPALSVAADEKYSDTYVYEVATELNGTYSFLTENSMVGQAATYTGAKALINFAIDTLGASEIELEGIKTNGNVYQLLKDVAVLGVDGAILYERSLSGGHEYDELDLIVDILDICAQSPEFIGMATGIISSSIDVEQSDDIGSQLLSCIFSKFEGEGAEQNFQNDLESIKALLEGFVKYNGDKEFSIDTIGDDLLAYLLDAENSHKIISNLASISSFQEITGILTTFGVSELANMLNIAENKEDAYNTFLTKLSNEMNDASVSTVNVASVEEFIEYLVKEDKSLADYYANPINQDVLSNYEEYVERTNNIVAVFNESKVGSFDAQRVFAGVRNIYAYNKTTDKWALLDSADTPDSIYMLAEYLVVKADEYRGYNAELNVEQIQTLLGNFVYYASAYMYEYANFNVEIANKVKSLESFETGLVNKEEILSRINLDADPSTAVDGLTKLLSSASVVLDFVTNEGEITDMLLDNFDLIGQVLDALHQYEMTAEMPEVLLKAILEMPDVAGLLNMVGVSFDVDTIVQNVNSGETTYEEFFELIQGLYKSFGDLI